MEENNSFVEKYIKKIGENKVSAAALILLVISALCTLLSLTENHFGAAMTIYSLTMLLASVTAILFIGDIYEKIKYHSDILIMGAAVFLIGIIIRVIHTGTVFSIRFFSGYALFAVTLILLILNLCKKSGSANVVTTLLIVSAAFSVFEFFYLNATGTFGFMFFIYRLSEAFLFIGYLCVVLVNKKNPDKLIDETGAYKAQIPSAKICIGIFVLIAAVALGIGAVKEFSEKQRIQQTVGKNNVVEIVDDVKKADEVKKEKKKSTITHAGGTDENPDAVQGEKEPETIILGDKVTTDAYEFTLNKVELSYDVMPDSPPSYYTHYPAESGQVYIYINASVKNLKQQSIECDEIYSVTANYDDGYTYRGFNIVTDTDGDFTYANITSVAPLQTLGVHCLIDCPEEVESSDKPLLLTIKFKDGSEYLYKVR